MTADSLTEKPKKKKKKTAETAEEKEIQAAEIEQKLEAGVEVNEIDAEVLLLDSEEIKGAIANIDALITEELGEKDAQTCCDEVLKQAKRD